MDISVCSDYLVSLSGIKLIPNPVSYLSSCLFYQKYACSIVPRVQIHFKISTLPATCCICQFQCRRPQSSDVLWVFVDLEKPSKVFFSQFSFSSSDTDDSFRQFFGRGNMDRLANTVIASFWLSSIWSSKRYRSLIFCYF